MEGIYSVMDAILPFAIFRYSFMKNALLALLFLTPLLALLGTMAVNKRMAFFSDALGHSALAGVGIGVLLGLSNVTVILVLFGVCWAILITRINRTGGSSSDTTISVFSSAGIALGLLILSGSGKYNRYSSILVGDILAITPTDILCLGIALAVGLALWVLLYNKPRHPHQGGGIRLCDPGGRGRHAVHPLGGRAADQRPADPARRRGPQRGPQRRPARPVQRDHIAAQRHRGPVRLRAPGHQCGGCRGAVRRGVLCRQPPVGPRPARSSPSINFFVRGFPTDEAVP